MKVKLQPLFYLDYDSGTGITNLTQNVKKGAGQQDVIEVDNFALGFQKTSYELMEAGVGAGLRFYYENATGWQKNFWANVGIIPMKGKEVISVRYAKTYEEAQRLEGFKKAPLKVEDLYQWKNGENIAYTSKGGVIFVGGIGVGALGVNTAHVAQGTWETYVEKIDHTHVYVKITKGKLDSLSVGTSAGMASIGVSQFNNADEGFSYKIDLNQVDGRKVYEDLVRGNVASAELISRRKVQVLTEAPVMKIETFKSRTDGRLFNFYIGLPIFLNASTSAGKIQSLTSTDLHVDKQIVKAQYGIYDTQTRTRAFGTHTFSDKMFYGARVEISDYNKNIVEKDSFGRMSWIYQDDTATASSLRSKLTELYDVTGIKSVLVDIPEVGSIGTAGVAMSVTFSEENTNRMIQAALDMSKKEFVRQTVDKFNALFAKVGTEACQIGIEPQNCESEMTNRTRYAAQKMHDALLEMNEKRNNAVEFTKAYAEFGKGLIDNRFALAQAMKVAGAGVRVNFSIEGTRISNYNLNLISTDKEGVLKRIDVLSAQGDRSLLPVVKRSRFRGVILMPYEPGVIVPGMPGTNP
ncbi:MAG: hypothetical protein BroJett040_02890 [Oligoflexia bacterium]|nr:MAG: hypothetical protein BroJett040_02890 [Oligoflexia bacterium]